MSTLQRKIFPYSCWAIFCPIVALLIYLSAYVEFRHIHLFNSCNYRNWWCSKSLTCQCARFKEVMTTASEVPIYSKKLLHPWFWRHDILIIEHESISRGISIESTHYGDFVWSLCRLKLLSTRLFVLLGNFTLPLMPSHTRPQGLIQAVFGLFKGCFEQKSYVSARVRTGSAWHRTFFLPLGAHGILIPVL